MPGPKPKPDHIKLVSGTFRADRARESVEVDDGEVEPPVGLPRDAAVVWSELAPPLIACGMLKPIDAAVFGQFCTMTAHLRAMWGLGVAPPSSYIGQWRLLAQMFGCAGQSSRVLARKKEPPSNPFARNGKRPPKRRRARVSRSRVSG